MRGSVRSAGLLLFAVTLLASCEAARAREEADAPTWLVERGAQQARMAGQSTVAHDFRFTDRLPESGITFENHVVDDAGRLYKLAHYDHGSGVCAADVDGDRRIDLYFATQLGASELWINAGDARFVNATDAAGLALHDAIAVGCAFADTDNDGDADLFVTTVRHGNRFFENTGRGTFRDATADANLGYVGHSSGATFFDYDRDGLLDLFVTNVGVYTTNERGRGGYYVGMRDGFVGHLHAERAEGSILYHNLGHNHFGDVSRAVGLVDMSWSGDATTVDVNDDGFRDVYSLDMQGGDHLWLNEHGTRFREATDAYFPKPPWGSMGAKVFDYDGDGRLDLFVVSMHPDMWVNVAEGDWPAELRKADTSSVAPRMIPEGKEHFTFGNELFANRGGGRFDEVSDAAGVETYWPWGPSVDDLNADGWDDIFIASGMNFPYRYGPNAVLLNESGVRFLASAFVLGVEPRRNGKTQQVWFTLACKGNDAFNPYCRACEAPGAREAGCLLDASGNVTMMGSLGTRAGVILDLDGDGDLDIVTNEFNAAPQVLVSDLAQRHDVRSLQVRLRGTHSNRDALGARVSVSLPDGRRILKVNDGKSGYLSQSDMALYFGLAAFPSAAEITVRWPSGSVQTIAGPFVAGRAVEIVEPE